MQDGIKTHHFSRIIGMVMPENHASARVLQKLGLSYERTRPYPETDLKLDFYGMQVAPAHDRA
jgi:RimJ/RimL family protein N-acetyltransferase